MHILMELKAVPARYEVIDQVARYRDALEALKTTAKSFDFAQDDSSGCWRRYKSEKRVPPLAKDDKVK